MALKMFDSAVYQANRISSAIEHQLPDSELSTANYQINLITYFYNLWMNLYLYFYNTQYNTHLHNTIHIGKRIFSSHFCTLNIELFLFLYYNKVKYKCILKYFKTF